MADQDKTFNADKRKEERLKSVITIGGETFHPAPKTPERMDRYWEELPDTVHTVKELNENPELLKEFSKEDIDVTYRQVALLLVDDQGTEPELEFLRRELDTEDADALLEHLMPPRGESERRGNSDAAEAATT